ncbi:MAG: ATP-binding protein, partial [Pseudolabrys sp.]|nr:ATP-binding protein [Pseudolabrys sp.]
MTDLLRTFAEQPDRQPLGKVISVDGTQAVVALAAGVDRGEGAQITVGKFLGILHENRVIIGLVTSIEEQPSGTQQFRTIAHLDLIGEIDTTAPNGGTFQRGVANYPSIGDVAVLMTNRELKLIYGNADNNHGQVGDLQQDASISVNVDIDELVSKHFAILGTTGVGKSTGVAIVLQKILDTRPNLRIFLVDPHNEYGRCFGDKAQVLTPRNLRLPFWLFNFEETIDAFFGGRPGVEEEVEILSEVIPLAKSAYLQYRGSQTERALAKKKDPRSTGFTADTPVPYRIEDLINLLDERMGKLDARAQRVTIHRLMQRIQTFRNHPRYAFMFENANIGGDTMAETLSHLFRLPPEGKPMTIMQLAGFPAEVVDSVVSVLCRMAFDFGLWSDGVAPLLFVCEEAHRYAPADKKIGFGPTRRALSRIAKEGRKYGVFLGLVTQRPAEIDPNIISQCSTMFVMRLSN